MNQQEIEREIRDNKSHLLVTLLDFADQVKNQTRDSFFRGRIDTVISDLSDIRQEMVKSGGNATIMKNLDMLVSDLTKMKRETQIELRRDTGTELIDVHKANIEYLKKRIHCEVNNSDRRIRLVLGLPLERQKAEPFKDE